MAITALTDNVVSGTGFSAQHGNYSGGMMGKVNEIITLVNTNETALAGATYPFNWVGSIAAAANFPTSAAVDKGDVYQLTADVTDNDATKTNTGKLFRAGAEIVWNGTTWMELGPTQGVTAVAATPYTVLAADVVVLVDTTTIAGASVMDLPTAASVAGKTIAFIDHTGSAGTWNIAVTPTGAEEIDGVAAAISIDVNYGSLAITSDGTNWVTNVAVREAILANTHRATVTGNPHVVTRAELSLTEARIQNCTLDAVANFNAAVGGTNANQFVPLQIVCICTAEVGALNGDAQIQIGTSAGGAELMAAFPLTGLVDPNQKYVALFTGHVPVLAGDATLHVRVTSADTGAAAGDFLDVYIIGREIA
jgi:hypothetical protein